MPTHWIRTLVFALAALAALAAGSAGCVVTNTEFCCTDADACQAKAFPVRACSDPARPYCDNAGTYGAANVCLRDPDTTACDATEDCLTPQRPVCDLQTDACGACSAATDCNRFPERPTCNTTNGACVACLGPSDCPLPAAPVCSSDGVCRGCVADGECPSGVCDEPAGRCVAEADIAFVATTGSGVACTRALPCATITAGVAAVSGTRRTVLVAAGSYGERIVITDKSLLLVGAGADVSGLVAGPLLDVVGTSNVTVEQLRLHDGLGAGGDGVRCQDSGAAPPSVTLREVRIDRNTGIGVNAQRCSVTLDRSTVANNAGGGVSIRNGTYQVRNSFIVVNGGLTTTVGGVELNGNAVASVFEFNTVAQNGAGTGVSAGVICTSGSPVTLSNNVIVGMAADQIATTGCAFTYTLSNEAIAGTGNIAGTPTFTSAQDFHLQSTSDGIDDADPAASLTVDVDGQARPMGGRADIGADEVQ